MCIVSIAVLSWIAGVSMDGFCLRILLFAFMIQFWDLQCASGKYD